MIIGNSFLEVNIKKYMKMIKYAVINKLGYCESNAQKPINNISGGITYPPKVVTACPRRDFD